MKEGLWCALLLLNLLSPLCVHAVGPDSPERRAAADSLSEYFEPGMMEESKPLPVKQIIGLAIAGLASVIILLFVFSFLMGPGEEIREKMSETSDPFFTIVAILLIVLFLAMLQTYYNELLAWLKATVSSG
jgi:predicted membrane protein